MKKLLLLLALIATIFALAACAQNGEEGGTGKPGEDENDPGTECKHGDEDGDWFVTNGGVDATCTTSGLTDKVYCAECGFVKTEQEVIPAKGHVDVVIPAVQATCLNAGSTQGIRCGECREVRVAPKTIPQKQHVVTETPHVDATCTVAGSDGGKHCSICLTTIEAPTILLPFGHDRGLEHIIVTEGYAPTCKDEGLTDNIYCEICQTDVLEAKSIPVTEHKAEDLVVVPGYAVTCVSEGLTDGEMCTFCGVTTIEQEVIPVDADAHPAEMITTLERVEPVCYADGLTEGKHCNACEVTFLPQEPITERPAHVLDEVNLLAAAVAPDCGAHTDGLTAHYACVNRANGCTYEVEPVVVEYKHNHGEWVTNIEASIGVAGEKYTFCTECGELIIVEIPALLPDGTAPEDVPGYVDPDGAV